MKSNVPLSSSLSILTLSNYYHLFKNSYITLDYLTFNSFLNNFNLLTFSLSNPYLYKQMVNLISSQKKTPDSKYNTNRGYKFKRISLLKLLKVPTKKTYFSKEKLNLSKGTVFYHKRFFNYEVNFKSNSISTLFPYTEPRKESLVINSKQTSTISIIDSAYRSKYRLYRRRLALYLIINTSKSNLVLPKIRQFYKTQKKVLEFGKTSRPTPLARVLAFLNNKQPFSNNLGLNDCTPIKTSQLNLTYKTYTKFYRNLEFSSFSNSQNNTLGGFHLYSSNFLKNFYNTEFRFNVSFKTKAIKVESSYTSTPKSPVFQNYLKNFRKAIFKKRFNLKYFRVNLYKLSYGDGLTQRFNQIRFNNNLKIFSWNTWFISLVLVAYPSHFKGNYNFFKKPNLRRSLIDQFYLFKPQLFNGLSDFKLNTNSILYTLALPILPSIKARYTLTYFNSFITGEVIHSRLNIVKPLNQTKLTFFKLGSIKTNVSLTTISYLLLKNVSETNFILSSTGFLFTSYRNLPITTGSFSDLSGIKARVNKMRLSFFYKEDLKKTLLRRPGVSKWLNSFNNKNVLLNTYNKSTQSLVLGNTKSYDYNKPTLKGNLMSSFFNNSLDKFRFLNWQSLNVSNLTMPNDLTLNRIRFKPGYQRVWRRARTSLNYLMNFRFRYQNRLTKKISRIRRLSRNQYLRLSELSLSRVLLNARMVLDLNNSLSLIQSNTVFINGSSILNPNLTVFVNDFIQVVVNLRFYIVYKWLINWNSYNLTKMRKLISSKNNSSKSDLSKQVSRSLPDWIFNTSFKKTDIPNYLEVDYFTLSIFVLYRPLNWSDYHPYTHLWDRSDIYSLYNWKYIT